MALKRREREQFNFSWRGKLLAIHETYKPGRGILTPDINESKNWNNTENVFIEGENLEVLKLLQEKYVAKIKLIYVDPPSHDRYEFVYKDDYDDNLSHYLSMRNNEYNVENNLNDEHAETQWLNMMYSRLLIAQKLLSDDGVIFISVRKEVFPKLRLICDEIFGELNLISDIVWERSVHLQPVPHFSQSHEYILCYAKNYENAKCNGLRFNQRILDKFKNPDNDPRGVWKDDMFHGFVNKFRYDITTPSGTIISPPNERGWIYSQARFIELLEDNRIWFGQNGNSSPRLKRFLSEINATTKPMSVWKYEDIHQERSIHELFGFNIHSFFVKPLPLISRMLELYTDKESIVLDLFAGTATTAHAVMKLNAEDRGNRKFICIQFPEPTQPRSEVSNAGYPTIADFAKERIRKAGDLYDNNNVLNGIFTDVGFKAYKLS